MSQASQTLIARIDARVAALDDTLQRSGFASYDPYDGLRSALGRRLAGRSQLRARVWQQLMMRSPVNVRPLVGVSRMVHTKTVSDAASAYAILGAVTGDPRYTAHGRSALAMLRSIASPGTRGLGWGLRFPFATRFTWAEPATANVFQTLNAVHAFLDGWEYLGESEWADVAAEGVAFLMHDIGYVTKGRAVIWNYWPGLTTPIYNVNGLMAGLMARAGRVLNDGRYRELAGRVLSFLREGQRADGAWPYSADSRGTWVDGFHTGYILEGLARTVAEHVDDARECLQRGAAFYGAACFQSDGLPKYYDTSVYPIDAQNAAQAIQTLVHLRDVGVDAGPPLGDVFGAVDVLLWNRRGYYNYRRTRVVTHRTPMHRWSTGPMFLALAYALRSLRRLDA